jgi:predicted amidohydrolase
VYHLVTTLPARDTRAADVQLKPMAAMTRFKAAAVHAAPVYMNKAATIKKTVDLIEQAAAKDVKLLVFPETFIPGYPVPAAARMHVSGEVLTLRSILQNAIRH